jgi:serine/threonine-protein kinase
VKPANIFFAVEPDGHVIPKILDFGIAKLPAAGSALTMDGSVLGTPHYMSPEQIRGQADLDGRSDMFSLAVVLYEMLTGVRVFQRDTAAASLAAVLEHEVDPDPRIEPRVWVVISRALAKRAYERYATCAELAEALRSAVAATDDDFAAGLQELRPARESIPESDVTKLGGLSSSAARPLAQGRPPRSILWSIGAAALVAAAAGTATLALTRPPKAPARVDEPAASSSVAVSSVAASSSSPAQVGPGATRDASLATEAPSGAATLAVAPSAAVSASAARPTPAVTGRPTARPPSSAALPPPTKLPPPPATSGTKPVATSPGF